MMEYHRTQKRKTCVPAGHIHCSKCDKSIIVPKSDAEGATYTLCFDCATQPHNDFIKNGRANNEMS